MITTAFLDRDGTINAKAPEGDYVERWEEFRFLPGAEVAIRRLNDSLGATSIVVTHDVAEALELVDYVYYMSAGKVEFQGTPDQVRAAGLSSLRQFVYGEPDGPVPFHYPAPDYRQDLLAQ